MINILNQVLMVHANEPNQQFNFLSYANEGKLINLIHS